MKNTPISFLSGSVIYLRSLFESDAEGPYQGWFNDEEVCRGNSHHVFPYTLRDAREYIELAAKTREHLILAIVTQNNHHHIGNIALHKIHPVYRSAEFSIVIGDKTAWGKGVGKEAGAAVMRSRFLHSQSAPHLLWDIREQYRHAAIGNLSGDETRKSATPGRL